MTQKCQYSLHIGMYIIYVYRYSDNIYFSSPSTPSVRSVWSWCNGYVRYILDRVFWGSTKACDPVFDESDVTHWLICWRQSAHKSASHTNTESPTRSRWCSPHFVNEKALSPKSSPTGLETSRPHPCIALNWKDNQKWRGGHVTLNLAWRPVSRWIRYHSWRLQLIAVKNSCYYQQSSAFCERFPFI